MACTGCGVCAESWCCRWVPLGATSPWVPQSVAFSYIVLRGPGCCCGVRDRRLQRLRRGTLSSCSLAGPTDGGSGPGGGLREADNPPPRDCVGVLRGFRRFVVGLPAHARALFTPSAPQRLVRLPFTAQAPRLAAPGSGRGSRSRARLVLRDTSPPRSRLQLLAAAPDVRRAGDVDVVGAGSAWSSGCVRLVSSLAALLAALDLRA